MVRGIQFSKIVAAQLLAAVSLIGTPARAQGPAAVGDQVETQLAHGMHLLVDVTANDSHGDGSAVLVHSVTQPEAGQVTVNPDNSLSFVLADPQGHPRVHFAYTLRDSRARTSTAEVCIGRCLNVIVVVCRPDSFSVPANQPAVLDVLGNDDGEDLEILRILPVEHQSNPLVAADGKSLIYTAGGPGSDDFLYEVREVGTSETFTGAVHVDIVPSGPGGGGGVQMGVAGQVTLAGSPPGTHNSPQFVPFGHTFERPVVIAQPASRNDSQEVVVRISQVTSTGFWAVLAEPPGGDGSHPMAEQVSFLAVEAGRWKIPGTNDFVEAHTIETNAVSGHPQNNAEPILFSQAFAARPMVLSQIQTSVNTTMGRPMWMYSRQAQVSTTGLLTALERDPANSSNGVAPEEQIGWVATNTRQGTWSQLDYSADVANQTVCPGDWVQCTVPYGRTFGTPPLFLAHLDTFFGAKGHLRRLSVGNPSAVVAFEDNTVGGLPPQHPGGDWVAFFALEAPGDLYGVPVNRPPQATDQTVVCTTGGSVSFAPSATDPDGDQLRIDEVEDAPPGLTHNGFTFTYAPPGGCSGPASFRHKVRDRSQGGFRSNWSEVNLQFQSTVQVDARDDTYLERSELVTLSGQNLDIVDSVLFANDLPANDLFLALVHETSQTHGTVSVSNQAPYAVVHYHPDPGYSGEATFTYTVQHSVGSPPYPEDTATVTVNVLYVNPPPEAVDDTAVVQRGVRTDLAVLANDTDPASQTLRVESVTQPANGLVAINGDGTVRYTASPDYFGPDSFTYTVTDDDPVDPETDTAQVQLTVNRDLRFDAFTNAAPDREVGDPLPGVTAEEGSVAWAGWQAQFGNGFVTSNGGGITAFAGLPLPALPLSETSTWLVESRLSLGTGNWAGIGFKAGASPPFWTDGSLWVTLHRGQIGGLPAAQLILRGAGGTPLTTAVVRQFESTGPNLVRLEYDTATHRASVWINGRRAIAGFQLAGPKPSLAAAGFIFSYAEGTPAGSMRVDDFSVRLRKGLSVPAPLILESFANKGFDRQNGKPVHRVTSQEGDARIWAANLRFGTVIAKVVPVPGAHTRGFAMVPFVPENYPQVGGLTAPVEAQARVKVGDAVGARVGFGYAFSDVGLRAASEVVVDLRPNGDWALYGPARRGVKSLVSGTLPSFDPNAYVVVRLRLGTNGVSLWFDANQVLSDFSPFVPIEPQVRWAGFEVEIDGSTSVPSVDSFNVSSEGGTP